MKMNDLVWSVFMQKRLRKVYIILRGSAVYNHPNLPNFHQQDWTGDGKSLV